MKDFNLARFISESNRIDPQPDFNGYIIPGKKPGDLMYDNTVRAWEVACDGMFSKEVPVNIVCAVHRELTRHVGVFEHLGTSGQYRTSNVSVGGQLAMKPVLVPSYIEEIWVPWINRTSKFSCKEQMEGSIEYWHDFYEVVHPFVDGNGRTGRLFYNALRQRFGLRPKVICYARRDAYYARIQEYRKHLFDLHVSVLTGEDVDVLFATGSLMIPFSALESHYRAKTANGE